MFILRIILLLVRALFRGRSRLALENLALRQQLAILRHKAPRPRLRRADRAFWVSLTRVWDQWRSALVLVKPEAVLRWQRQGFRHFWRWKSRGRPCVSPELIRLIRRMSLENPLWGAPRICSELLLLGYDVAEANVTAHPTTAWTAQQIREAFPGDGTEPHYLQRDRDGAYGDAFRRVVRAIGIQEILTAPQSPWQNPYAERVIGSKRRECLDHLIVLSEDHLRWILREYVRYYNETRPHLSLERNAPMLRSRELSAPGAVVAVPQVGGLHHRYTRAA